MIEIEIGDPVVVVNEARKASAWQVTYHGQSRSREIEGIRWKQGETKELMDMEIVMRARRTAHFQVMPPRVMVEHGRVFKIFKIDHAREVLDAYFYEDPASIPQPTYEFTIVSPSGALRSFNEGEIRLPTQDDLVALAEAEHKEMMKGKVPYRGRVRIVRKGKWGRGCEL